MFTIRRAEPGDVDGAISALGEAFARDPLMLHLFRESPECARAGAEGFFSILLRARLALGMPAFVLVNDGKVQGAAMGYDADRPAWPQPLADEMQRFEAGTPGFAARVDAYGRLADAHEPAEDHYYLGVIGVHPSLQGKGAGTTLLDAFCAPSFADPRSHGVYLETASAAGLRFYVRNGFERRGEGSLDGTPVWCLYRRT